MKATIDVKQTSAYSQYNGKFFEVLEIGQRFISVDINGITTDFLYEEALIENFREEWQQIYDNSNWYGGIFTTIHNNLQEYAKKHGITWNPEYNCPA